MSVDIRNFLKARRDRAVGSILGHAERSVYPHLPREERQALRTIVIDALNGYHDSVLDLVKSDDGAVRNEEVVALLTRLDEHLSTSAR